MAGVGRLLFVDHDELTWANVGRHVLGAESVGKNKAKSLADELQKSYPHSQIDGFDTELEEFAEANSNLVSECHLIISATANWESENILNLRQVREEITQPIMYVWTEPHACAGHAVHISPSGPCFRCGFDPAGRPKLELTVWPSDRRQQREPACGAVFQPFNHTDRSNCWGRFRQEQVWRWTACSANLTQQRIESGQGRKRCCWKPEASGRKNG